MLADPYWENCVYFNWWKLDLREFSNKYRLDNIEKMTAWFFSTMIVNMFFWDFNLELIREKFREQSWSAIKNYFSHSYKIFRYKMVQFFSCCISGITLHFRFVTSYSFSKIKWQSQWYYNRFLVSPMSMSWN